MQQPNGSSACIAASQAVLVRPTPSLLVCFSSHPALTMCVRQLTEGKGDLQGLRLLKVSFPSLTLTSMGTGLTSPWIPMVRLRCCTLMQESLHDLPQVPISLLFQCQGAG